MQADDVTESVQPDDLARNRVVIAGRLDAREPVRYTPAGVPIITATLLHESEQTEADRPRRVSCPVALVVIGAGVAGFDRIEAGSALKVAGFLATRHRNSTALVLHVTEFRTIQNI